MPVVSALECGRAGVVKPRGAHDEHGLVGFGVHSSHQAHTERGSSLLRRAALSVWLLTRNGWIPFPLSGGWALLGLQLLRSTRRV